MKKLLAQVAQGPTYRAELQATADRHGQYAAAHGYDFWCLQGWQGSPISWARFRVMQQAFAQGYDFIAYLDCDAIIIDTQAELSDALAEDQQLGMVWYDYRDVAKGQPDNWQNGVIYARNTTAVRHFLAAQLSYEPADPAYLPKPRWWLDPDCEQTVGDHLLASDAWRGFCTPIAERWNVLYRYEHGVTPVVLHLAGLAYHPSLRVHRADLLRQLAAHYS
jgi:hypothetical protein